MIRLMAGKRLIWLGSSLDDVRAFPPEARRAAGYQLRRVQDGLLATDGKPMGTVGPGVTEIRIHAGAEYRVLYLARLTEAIYILHGFEKRSRMTPRAEIDLARERLAELLSARRKRRDA
jgi:phage-related protein